MANLGALLLNPPLDGRGASTLRAIDVARRILNCDAVRVANLFSIPTKSVVEINLLGVDASGWRSAQADIRSLIAGSDALLAAWGVSGLHGRALAHRKAQVAWATELMDAECHTGVWTIRGQARHPSRWHQYVSDRRGRVAPGSFHERLSQVLHPVTPDELRFDREVSSG